MSLIKSKKNIICCIAIFIEFILIEFPYIFLVGPIGIFGDSEFVIRIINIYGKILKIVSIDKNMLVEVFVQRIGNCDVPCAQLARIYADNWGVVLLVCIPIQTITYINNQIKRTNTMVKVCRLWAFLTFYILTIIVFLSIIPFIVEIKLSILYGGGSAMEMFKYIAVWLIPSIMVLIGLEILLALAVKEKLGQILSYVLIIVPSLPPVVSSYPFYKLVIRFNRQSEAFYNAMRGEILMNRICIMAVTFLIFAALFHILKRRQKVV